MGAAGTREPPNAAVRSGLAVFQTTRENRIVGWNEAAERLTGIPAEEAVGRDCWDVIRGRDDAGSLVCHRGCSIARLARGGWPVSCAGLCVRMPSGLDRVTVSTIVVGDGEEATVLHPMRPSPVDAPSPEPELPRPELTPRQRQILELLADGVRPKEIALRLGLSVATVRNHVNALLRRLGASSQLEAAAIGRALGASARRVSVAERPPRPARRRR